MTAHGDAAAICRELAELLEGQPFHAGLVHATGLAAAKGLEHAAPLYQSLDWWGGAGSVADEAGVELPAETRKRVLELIADLRDVFHEHGIDYARADMWSGVFRDWLRDGVFNRDRA